MFTLNEKEILVKILETFNSATDLTAIMVDLEGNPLDLNEHLLEKCHFCKIIRAIPEAKTRCSQAYARAGKMAALIGEPYIFRCPAGLIEWSAPILFNGRHLGSIICGQVLMWKPEDFFWIELTMMNKKFPVDMSRLITAAQELPVVSGKKVQAAADLLFFIANHIVKTSMESLNQQKKIEKQRFFLREEMVARKLLETGWNERKILSGKNDVSSYLKKEKEFLSLIKQGKREDVLENLKGILAEMQNYCHQDLGLLKVCVSELLAVISRKLIEKGAAAEQILALNHHYAGEILKLSAPNQILSCFHVIVEQYLDFADSPMRKNSQVIQQSLAYIQNNYHLDLRLEKVAQAVYLSPYYLSHIFKEETGCTILEYLTKIRIERAKKLLSDQKNSVKEVAQKVGYNNPSYFSKIFRSLEGLTPSEFRQGRG
ncbi:PocR ligand-binding domain-containing protein [Candidatus Formimonas warabiya]|uniref:HTH araC/xylS-type domain-containing protein n=1 Tax=Formimonas warabiya TaxID=1761012 RepID=A0A3G1KZN8_FORW1|nr:PocR ligand-binding domain-containing protein [Candidatus Formimonas warabiya]ATW27880.1 hypothetical protein DCMF_26770 [Candidatus Formimonas warabiya]